MSIQRRYYVQPAPKLPLGLVELMDGLARDVLKQKPDNIYEFCAQHMQALLELRDGHAPKSFMTLDQKITKAQKKVKERAEQRRHAHDEKLRLTTCDVDDKEEILTSEIPPASTEILETSENKREEKVNIVSNNEKTGQEIENDVVSPEFKDSDSNQIAPAKFSVEDTKQDMEKNDINKQEALEITLTENDNITQGSDDSAENKNTNYSTEENLLQQNITSNEFVVTDSAVQNLNETVTLITEDKDHIENKLDTELENVNVQKDCTEFNNEMLTELIITKRTGHETISKNDGPENGISSPNITNFDNTSDTKDETNKNSKDLDGQKVVSVESMNLPKQYSNENVLNGEVKNNSFEYTHADTVNQEDKKILAVILSVQPDISHQNQESNLVLNNELGQKVSEVSEGSESAAESTDYKTHNSSMDLETAAITIQKVFRSFLFKTKTASYDDPTAIDINLLNEDKDKDDTDTLNKQIKERRPLGISRMDTVLQTVNEEKSLSLSTDDSSTLSSAATIIQAHVRGFLARNKFNLNKTISTNSCVDSDGPSIPSLEADSDNRKSKTVLNIHIVPEGGHFISRDESIMTSMDLSLDHSPPSSINLHPLGYDKSERRKQLKREDAIQSVSPPSNNSGKLSDDVDSIKEVVMDEESKNPDELPIFEEKTIKNSASVASNTGEGNITYKEKSKMENPDLASDEMDVITPYVQIEEKSSRESDNESKLLHSGEFHDIVVPTNVSRCDTSVVREFQNVLVYFILWNN